MSRLSFLPRDRGAFRHRAFTLYWSAQLISMMGTFMQQVALGYLVYDLTGSKWLLGIIGAVQMGPSLLLSLPAGVLADRVQRRRLILGTQSIALVLAFILATLTVLHLLQVWEILAVSVVSGIAIAVESPARQAFVVDLVGREDLSNAIAWNTLVINGARVVGPALGGIAIAHIGIAPIFYYNSFSFLAMIVVLARLHMPPVLRLSRRHPLAELVEGLNYTRRAPSLLMILALVAAIGIFAMNFPIVMPIFARDVLHTGPVGLGWMWTAYGLGAVFGSMTVVRWSRAATRGPMLMMAAAATSLAELLMAGTEVMPLTLSALILVGWSSATFFASANASIQYRVTDHVRGRVLSLYSMIFSGTAPLGALFSAGLAAAYGVSMSLAAAGGICLVASILAIPLARRYLWSDVAVDADVSRTAAAGTS